MTSPEGGRPPRAEPIPPEEMLGESDWDDEDLLTIDEATGRLGEEVELARDRARRTEQLLSDAALTVQKREELQKQLEDEKARAQALAAAAARISASRSQAQPSE